MDESESDIVIALVNAPEQQAEAIAQALVEAKLAACVNVIGRVISFYRWQGKLERDAESTLIIKTRRCRMAELTQLVKSLHPYTVPEVIALAVDGSLGNPDYLAWVLSEVGP